MSVRALLVCLRASHNLNSGGIPGFVIPCDLFVFQAQIESASTIYATAGPSRTTIQPKNTRFNRDVNYMRIEAIQSPRLRP